MALETAAGAAWGFAARNWRWLLPLLASLALAIALRAAREDAEDWRQRAAAEKAAHALTVANYRAAAETARRQDLENLARVKAEQDRITEKVSDDYEARLADARARADALRLSLAKAAADPGRGGAARLSAVPDPAARAAEAPADGFPVAERLKATEQAIQLDALIDWVEAQGRVAVNGGGS